jgi:hypothetical protein
VSTVRDEIARLDGNHWLSNASREIQRQQGKYGDPDGSARSNLIENFHTQTERLQELNSIRVDLGHTTLAHLDNGLALRRQTITGLNDWLQEEHNEPGRSACLAVMELLHYKGGEMRTNAG